MTAVTGVLGQLARQGVDVIGVLRDAEDGAVTFIRVPQEVAERIGEVLITDNAVVLTGHLEEEADYLVVTDAVLGSCPSNCGATDKQVYRAGAHPLTCAFMMRGARRCREHDELLRPDEPGCPYPGDPEDLPDAHRRLS